MNPLPPGLQVDGLQVQAVLFRGKDAIHYRVVDMALGKTFELKEFAPSQLDPRRAGDGSVEIDEENRGAFVEARKRFLEAARQTGRLDHPALPQVLRIIEAGGTVYQLRPDAPGKPLARLLEEGETLDADDCRDALMTCADALVQLHEQGRVHGNLSPESVWQRAEGGWLLRGLGSGTGVATSEAGPEIAPECLDDPPSVSPASDAYALAATLLQAYTGEKPATAEERLAARQADAEDPLRNALASVPGALGDALSRALRLDPKRRPTDLADWRDSLDRIDWRLRMAQSTGDGTSTDERRPWLPVVLGVAITLLMVAGGVFLLSDRELPVDEWLEDVDMGAERDRGPRVAAPTDEERARWEAALEADTLLGYRNFLADYPTSIYAEQAQLQIDILDERAWNELSAEDTRPAYVDYLEQFPTGLHQAEALQRIEAMDAEAALRERERLERERRDELAWEQARDERTVASMDRYIESWPAGLHIEEAQRIRRDLLDRRNDAAAFETARDLDTIDAYQAYLNAFPRGQSVTEALEAIERLTLEPGKPFRDCPVCPEMRVMPVGAFRQGAADDDPLALEQERPRRTVSMTRPFAAGIFEVTMGQWDACVEEGGCSHRPPDNGWGRGDRPVMMVSWNDTQEYLAWLSAKTGEVYRLPTESEWEYIARADTRGPWLGDSPEAVCRFGNVAGRETGFEWQHEACEDPVPAGTAPVGAFRANRAGIFDVIGNVAEWTADCMNLSYLDAPTDGSAWTRGICSSHMARGGSWVTGSRDIRLSSRFNLRNGDRNDFTGFRVVREISD
ncbi:MAG: SUMF1/EgtB/PvdO family nonheme iron enzyme [Xanthomonadales bacterium]|nr:SUMF1/EgtB/PvdO family nonheme iron enzyme [Xanthomonadales bacterium]